MGRSTNTISHTVSYNASKNCVVLHHWEQNRRPSKLTTENTQNDRENGSTQHLSDKEIHKHNNTAITDTMPRTVTPVSSSTHQHEENDGVESHENNVSVIIELGSENDIKSPDDFDSPLAASNERAQCSYMITFNATNPERNPKNDFDSIVDTMQHGTTSQQAQVAMTNGDYPLSNELQFNNADGSLQTKSFQPDEDNVSLQAMSFQPIEANVPSKVVCDTRPSLNHPVADKDGKLFTEKSITSDPRAAPTFCQVPYAVGKPRWPAGSSRSISLPQLPVSSERVVDSQSQTVQIRDDSDDSREAYGDIENGSLMSSSYPSDGIKYRNGSLSRRHMHKVGGAIDARFLLACDSDRSDRNVIDDENKISQEQDHSRNSLDPSQDPGNPNDHRDTRSSPELESNINSGSDVNLDEEGARAENANSIANNVTQSPSTKTRAAPNTCAFEAPVEAQQKGISTSGREQCHDESTFNAQKEMDWYTKGVRPKMKIVARRKSRSSYNKANVRENNEFEMTCSIIKPETMKSSQEPKKIKEGNRENDQEATTNPNNVSRSDPTAPKAPISHRPDYITYHIQGVTWNRNKLEGPLKRVGTFQLAPYESRYYHITPCPIKHRKHRQQMRERTECNCDGCWWETTLFILNHDCPIFEDHISDSWIPPDSKLRPRDSESLSQPAKGIVVVASNNKFKESEDNRGGSNEDCRKIRDCFGLLGYLVHEWEDCSSAFLADIMVLYNKSRIMDDLTSFHFFVLSHGKAGQIQGVDGRFVDVEKVIGAMELSGGAMAKMQSFLYICTCQGGRDIPQPPLKSICSLKESRNRRRTVDRFAPGGTNEDTPATAVTVTNEYDVESFLSHDGPGDEKEPPPQPQRPPQMSFTWMRKQPRPKRNLVVFYAASEDQISFRHSRFGTLVVSSICRNVFYYSDMGPGMNLSTVRCLQKVREEVRELSKHTSDQEPVVIYNDRLPKINECAQ